jgi:hypothetical protein
LVRAGRIVENDEQAVVVFIFCYRAVEGFKRCGQAAVGENVGDRVGDNGLPGTVAQPGAGPADTEQAPV